MSKKNNNKRNKKREQIVTLLKDVLYDAISSQLSSVRNLSIQTMSLGETQGPIIVNKDNRSETDPFSLQGPKMTVIVNSDDELVKSLRERIRELHNTLQPYEEKYAIIYEKVRDPSALEKEWMGCSCGVPYEVQINYWHRFHEHIDELWAEANDIKAEEKAIIARFVQEDEILQALVDLIKRELEHIDSE